MTNKEILGGIGSEESTVAVQLADGRFIRMTPSEAAAHAVRERDKPVINRLLEASERRLAAINAEREMLARGGSDPSGSEGWIEAMQRLGRR